MDYKVDVAIWAHEHNYERFWPMYNFTVMNGTTDPNQPYTDARAPLHIVTGSAVSDQFILTYFEEYKSGFYVLKYLTIIGNKDNMMILTSEWR